MKQNVLISVLNWKNFQETKKCIESIFQLESNNYQILIVDNNSPDDSYEKLQKEFPTIRIVQSQINNGYASGHKMSVNYALENGFQFIWILNNDLLVQKNTLNELICAYNQYGNALYGSISLKKENPDIINFGGGITDDITKQFNYNSFEDIMLDKYMYKYVHPVQSIEGSSLFIPLEIIKKYGFMREDFFMYGEETHYCYLLKQYGIYSYIVPRSIVIHSGGNSLKDANFIESYYRRRNYLYFIKQFYAVGILVQINKTIGLFNLLKYFIKRLMYSSTPKDSLYYFNLANLHALIGKKGKTIDPQFLMNEH